MNETPAYPLPQLNIPARKSFWAEARKDFGEGVLFGGAFNLIFGPRSLRGVLGGALEGGGFFALIGALYTTCHNRWVKRAEGENRQLEQQWIAAQGAESEGVPLPQAVVPERRNVVWSTVKHIALGALISGGLSLLSGERLSPRPEIRQEVIRSNAVSGGIGLGILGLSFTLNHNSWVKRIEQENQRLAAEWAQGAYGEPMPAQMARLPR